ncbi:hypothetical protein BCF44_102479 [Kutzneria buriramensis]|uniref:Streptogrisin C n=2 Tax=Kutzneria buriramensis TaxID=1045776 RepID=A0A3E0I6I6_9PSEU|nr:hypothetical protein BCF44_102479 [Kutzneria buriramensis]
MMSTTRARRLLFVAPLAAACLVGAPAAAIAQPTGLDPAVIAQFRAEAPLDAVANAVGEQGRGAFADTYSNLYVDTDHNRVTVYATDAGRAAKLLAAAKKAHPDIDLGLATVVHANYTKAALDAGIAKIMAGNDGVKAADLTVYSAAAAPDGSGIQVTAKESAASPSFRSALTASAGSGIPVTVTAGKPITADTWRWNDTKPFIGGDVLLGNARKSGYRAQCTAGLATEKGGHDYLLTAAHCFPSGAHVYGEGDSVGSWGFNFGNSVGTTTSVNDHWDAEVIDTGASGGAGSNSDEADTPTGKWYVVNSSAYSYNGQTVCQDGARSYYNGHGVPCGIKVNNQDVTYTISWDDGSTHSVRGVHGAAGYAATEGDSGGLVFTVTSSTARQARGMVSAGNSDADLYWTESPDILGAFGMTLNPHV